jgi:acyl-CoA reductase-like NAD-dependent aldehyde dehydrogenase
VLVHQSIYDDFGSVCARRAVAHRLTFDPRHGGAVVSQEQLDRIRITSALPVTRSAGAVGGNRHGDIGYYFEPTIFTGVRNDMRIAQEEVFGPVMCMLPFETEDEVYAIANDVEYGLAAGVWTNDLARAHRAARRLKAGTVWINTYGEVSPTIPYGGVKQSGHGRTLGEQSLDELMQTKSVWMRLAR